MKESWIELSLFLWHNARWCHWKYGYTALGCNNRSFACLSYSLDVRLLWCPNLGPCSRRWRPRSTMISTLNLNRALFIISWSVIPVLLESNYRSLIIYLSSPKYQHFWVTWSPISDRHANGLKPVSTFDNEQELRLTFSCNFLTETCYKLVHVQVLRYLLTYSSIRLVYKQYFYLSSCKWRDSNICVCSIWSRALGCATYSEHSRMPHDCRLTSFGSVTCFF